MIAIGQGTRSPGRRRATATATTAGAAPFRADIQALRALAVALVVAYHLWPTRLSGGYVGVDIFFVISGFLITAHLLREVTRDGTVSLSRFWARRIRRLLPASLTVLAVSLIGAWIWLPDSLMAQTIREIAASSLYVVNWVLAADSVDYLASTNVPSLVQHFWSLSVEEQFYVIWPILIVATALIVKKARSSRSPTSELGVGVVRAIGLVLSIVFIASLWFSISLTSAQQSAAYFNTFTRAWEFAAGGLLAVALVVWPKIAAASSARGAARATVVLTAVGMGLILASALLLTDASPFPGSIALVPVAGAVLVLFAGSRALVPRLNGVFAIRPVQRIGDLSYGIYLWHWPLIVLVPLVTGRPNASWQAVGIIVASIALAQVTKTFIEDPVRVRSWWTKSRVPAFGLAAAGAALLVGVVSVQTHLIDLESQAAAQRAVVQLEEKAVCFGAAAMAPGAECDDKFTLPDDANLAFAASDLDPDWCLAGPAEEWRSCEYGEVDNPVKTIALVGDSHAAALVPAFDEYYAEKGWKVVTYLRNGCPALSAAPIDMAGRGLPEQEACASWSQRVLQEVSSRDDIESVVFTQFSTRYVDLAVSEAGRLSAAAVASTWQSLLDRGKSVVLVRDVPDTNQVNVPACLSAAGADRDDPCSFARDTALPEDLVTETARAMPAVSLVDLSSFFCDSRACHSVIGDVVVYADENHVSGTYTRSLAPYLGEAITVALAR